MIIRVIKKTTSHKPLKRDSTNEMQTERNADANFMYTIDNFCDPNKIIFFQTIIWFSTGAQYVKKLKKMKR